MKRSIRQGVLVIAVAIGGCADAGELSSPVGPADDESAPVTALDAEGADSVAPVWEWDGIGLATSGSPPDDNCEPETAIIPCDDDGDGSDDGGGGEDPGTGCGWFTNGYGVSCSSMTGAQITAVKALFQDPVYRDSDPDCAAMKNKMSAVVDTAGFVGTGSYAGLSALSSQQSTGVSVWFHADVFTNIYSLKERRRIVGHEAYHLKENSHDHVVANAAAYYCFSYSSTNPWAS